MQILLANAKIMNTAAALRKVRSGDCTPWTEPQFQAVANQLALEMAACDVDTLERELDCSRKLAAENWQRYQDFFTAEKLPAILAYNGQAYKHLKAATLGDEALRFGQQHLWITCFLYGLLRPMDAVVPYRMEHTVHLPSTGGRPINQYWRRPPSVPPTGGKITDVLIDSVKADDGVLLHLSTEEYEHLFDWPRVCREVRVVHPLFYVRQSSLLSGGSRGAGSLKMQAVWAKACRGAMVRFVLQNQITTPDELCAFSHEGFEFAPRLGDPDFPHFVRE